MITNLEKLHLSLNDIGDEAATAIANAPQLSNLKELYIGSTNVGNEGTNALVTSKYLTKLIKPNYRSR